jgi:hypothetical protein
MVWTERVRSLANHVAKVRIKAVLKMMLVVIRATPCSAMLSVISVPTMLSSTTASQYTPGTYLRARNWTTSTPIKIAPIK